MWNDLAAGCLDHARLDEGENAMITCCPEGLAARRNDGTRPVIFKIERMDVE